MAAPPRVEIGRVAALFRYPVKSMAGEKLDAAELGWHGLTGDRRLALRRVSERGAFPWLTASRLPELLRYVPRPAEAASADGIPSGIRTPEGRELRVFGETLVAEIGRKYGSEVEMMQVDHGVFDEASISVIASVTADEIARSAGCPPDIRRFRPNIVVHLTDPVQFGEDGWVGGQLRFGGDVGGPAIAVTMRDLRCAMVNLDPESASSTPGVLKEIARANQSTAGVYGTVVRIGWLEVGQPIFLQMPDGAA